MGTSMVVGWKGNDSDIEAEVNERHNRRPRPNDGPVDRSVEYGFLETSYAAHEKPSNTLQLDFVYGYRGNDARHNLFYTVEGLVVYHAGATGVVYDSAEHQQQFFTGHTDDIVCLAMHPERELVATGQVGRARPSAFGARARASSWRSCAGSTSARWSP
mmetsp:Transcript_11585/g.38112  ORF Transcript_11585/g.38112 Transcript_11585/m.38112 type:complete len:159 (+) Transcript_11585:180-656(+)